MQIHAHTYLYKHIYVCIYIHMHLHWHIHLHIHIHTHIYIYIHLHIQTYSYCWFLYVHVCMHGFRDGWLNERMQKTVETKLETKFNGWVAGFPGDPKSLLFPHRNVCMPFPVGMKKALNMIHVRHCHYSYKFVDKSRFHGTWYYNSAIPIVPIDTCARPRMIWCTMSTTWPSWRCRVNCQYPARSLNYLKLIQWWAPSQQNIL